MKMTKENELTPLAFVCLAPNQLATKSKTFFGNHFLWPDVVQLSL